MSEASAAEPRGWRFWGGDRRTGDHVRAASWSPLERNGGTACPFCNSMFAMRWRKRRGAPQLMDIAQLTGEIAEQWTG